MAENKFEIRYMQTQDLEHVMRIQALCYSGDIPETQTSLSAKLSASPTSCFVAMVDEIPQAYLFSLPWRMQAPPNLNAQECVLPSSPDGLYLHDLSVAPHVREHGVGRALVQAFFQTMQEFKFTTACLVAVQNSGNYWRRYGFQTIPLHPQLQEKLASYGESAEFLVWEK